MQTQKPHKIDLSSDYPCPCRRRGRLVPITLTDAFGCDRCQHIFVVQENGHTIEQLVNHYPYKKIWRWTGHQWMTAHPMIVHGVLPMMLPTILLGLTIVLLIAALQSQTGMVIPIGRILVLVVVILVSLIWVAAHRRSS